MFSNLNASIPSQYQDRIYTVVYDKVVANPEQEMRAIYNFLGYWFGEDQKKWVDLNYPEDTADCPHGFGSTFADCRGRKDSFEEMKKWQETLSEEEKQDFLTYERCQQVFKAYGFEM